MRASTHWAVVVGTVFAAGLTSVTAGAYRTAADTSAQAGTERVRWTSGVMSYDLVDPEVPGLSTRDVHDELSKALRAWQAPACSGFQFAYRGVTFAHAQAGDGRNTIEWITTGWAARGWSADAPGITDVQYTRVGTGPWEIAEADIYLNAESHTWIAEGADPSGARDVLSVLTHEAGHALGLLHPCELNGEDGAPRCSDVPGAEKATMYPVWSASQAVLSRDDIGGACFLYPKATCETTGCPTGSVCTASVCLVACGATVCKPDELCYGVQCVRPSDLAAEAGTGCSNDTQCPSGQTCLDRECGPFAGALGDPCVGNTDCRGAICSADGYCAPSCTVDSDCAKGYRCDTTTPVHACVNDLRPMGALCSEANQCLGNQCVAGMKDVPICTRLCGGVHAACPAGWECTDTGDRSVCTPKPAFEAGGGCAVGMRVPGFEAYWAGLAALAWSVANRRRGKKHAARAGGEG